MSLLTSCTILLLSAIESSLIFSICRYSFSLSTRGSFLLGSLFCSSFLIVWSFVTSLLSSSSLYLISVSIINLFEFSPVIVDFGWFCVSFEILLIDVMFSFIVVGLTSLSVKFVWIFDSIVVVIFEVGFSIRVFISILFFKCLLLLINFEFSEYFNISSFSGIFVLYVFSVFDSFITGSLSVFNICSFCDKSAYLLFILDTMFFSNWTSLFILICFFSPINSSSFLSLSFVNVSLSLFSHTFSLICSLFNNFFWSFCFSEFVISLFVFFIIVNKLLPFSSDFLFCSLSCWVDCLLFVISSILLKSSLLPFLFFELSFDFISFSFVFFSFWLLLSESWRNCSFGKTSFSKLNFRVIEVPDLWIGEISPNKEYVFSNLINSSLFSKWGWFLFGIIFFLLATLCFIKLSLNLSSFDNIFISFTYVGFSDLPSFWHLDSFIGKVSLLPLSWSWFLNSSTIFSLFFIFILSSFFPSVSSVLFSSFFWLSKRLISIVDGYFIFSLISLSSVFLSFISFLIW